MTKEEALIRRILGPIKGGVHIFACAIEITSHLLFEENMAQDDIQVTKHVYPEVAKKTDKSYVAVARQLERMGNLCWDRLSKEEREQYIGRQLQDIRAPRDMLFYLAFYCYFDKPYYEIVEANPELLFHGGSGKKS